MSGSAIALVLASAALHALWNRYLHSAPDRVGVMALSYFAGGLLLAPWAIANPPARAWAWVGLSIVAHGAYQVLLTSAYGQAGLAVAYPIARGTAPLLVAAGGWILLDQTPSTTSLIGITVLSAGLLVLAAVGQRAAQLTGVGMAVLTGVAITGYTLVDARAVEDADPTGYLSIVGVGAGAFVLVGIGAGRARLKPILRHGIAVGAMQFGSYLLLLFALQRAQAAQVASLRQLSVLIGVVVAGEAFRRQTYVAGALVVAGAILIAA